MQRSSAAAGTRARAPHVARTPSRRAPHRPPHPRVCRRQAHPQVCCRPAPRPVSAMQCRFAFCMTGSGCAIWAAGRMSDGRGALPLPSSRGCCIRHVVAVVRGVQHLAGLPSRLPCGVPLHETRKEVGLPCCAGELGRSASMPVRRFIVRLPAAAAPAAPAAKGGADDGDATVRMRHTPRERASCSGVCWGR